jgi:hypothetical protein
MALNDYFKQFTYSRKTAGDGRLPGAYADVGTAWGYLQQQTNSEASLNGALKVNSSYLLFTYPSTQLLNQDRITYSGVTYVVQSGGGPDGVASLGKHKEYVCSRIDDGQ